MAYDQIRVWNLALSHCASQRFVASLTETSTEARLCGIHYEPARDAVLGALNWGFARRFAALALVAEADDQDWANEWGYAYRYPASCVRIRRLLVGDRIPTSPPPFELSSDADGLLIMCDLDDARVAYTHQVTNVAVYPEAFCRAVAWRMAEDMAMPLSGRTDLRDAAATMYQRTLAEARVLASGEQQLDPEPDAESIRVRQD